MSDDKDTDNSDLLDCPFCGGTACIYSSVKSLWIIFCELCGAEVENSNINNAKRLWNSRVKE